MALFNAKIFKSGEGTAISLSDSVLEEAGLSNGDDLMCEVEEGRLIFMKKDIKDEIQDFYRNGGKYNEKEFDFGEHVGKEVI